MLKIPRFRPNLSASTALRIFHKSFFPFLTVGDPDLLRRFEEAFAAYIGVRNAVSVPSGRMGLYLIMKNLGLEQPSQVILPAFTYWAVPRIVSYLRFEPVFADIDYQTCNIDVSLIEKYITSRSRVIVPTHLYGRPCRMDAVMTVAKKYNLLVVEDCVQACGARYQGRNVGSFGEAAYFAFGITKNISLLGGGIVATNNDILAQKIRAQVRAYSPVEQRQLRKKAAQALVLSVFSHPRIFSNVSFPLMYLASFFGRDAGSVFEEKEEPFTTLPDSYFRLMPHAFQAALGLQQLERLDSLNDKRMQNALFLLKNLQGIEGISLPALPDADTRNIFTNFPIRSKARSAVARRLLKRGIDTSSGYMKAHHTRSPNAVALQQDILHLPVYPSLSEDELLGISRAVREISKKGS